MHKASAASLATIFAAYGSNQVNAKDIAMCAWRGAWLRTCELITLLCPREKDVFSS